MATISKLMVSSPSLCSTPRSNTRLSSSSNMMLGLTNSKHRCLFYSTSLSSTFPLLVKCSASGGNGVPLKRTTLHELYDKEGQSPWYDNLCRPVTDLLPLISSGVRGVTSNPAIFQKAISTSDAYNEQFGELIKSGKDIESAYWELVIKDIQDASKLFEPIYDETNAGDGYVSVEVSPALADDTQGTIEAAKWLHKVVSRPNVYIKIPATAPCIPSIKETIANGISVNVTRFSGWLDGIRSSV